tara:strand:- start:449 stop:697 length:249 start_codon:yes stop_codon:yes gene_type:complete
MSFNTLKKAIKYRVSYSGTKETDILYKRYFLDDFDKFNYEELSEIKNLFDTYSDNEMYDFLTNLNEIPNEYQNLFKKILDDK